MLANLFFGSCANETKRAPSSLMHLHDHAIVQNIYNLKQKKIELHAKSIDLQKNNKQSKNNEIQLEIQKIDAEIQKLESKVINIESNEVKKFEPLIKAWRIESEQIELSDPSLYTNDKNVVFSISTFEAKATKLRLTQNIFSNQNFTNFSAEDKPRLEVEMSCLHPFTMKYGITSKNIKAKEILTFSLGDKKYENDYRDFIFTQDLSECLVKLELSTEPKGPEMQFRIVNESKKLNTLSTIISSAEVCATKKDSESFFETSEFTNMTCPVEYENIKILPEPEDSLHARVIQLLGRDLPKDFVKNGNPYAKLDFSKAPKLDAILVSYLVFRADFYGTLLARLMAYHADQGTLVRVIVSDVISLKKDKALYERLMTKHQNIKFIRYEFNTSQDGGKKVSELHRTNHVKLFITYSKDNSDNSMVIVGGRNIHDGFVFKTPVNVKNYPEIVDYNGGDESWAYWRDFEMVIRGQNFVESMIRHYMSFYHINKENLVMKSPAVIIQKSDAEEAKSKTMRHYISIPFKDGANLNTFYAKLIDQSKKKILISSPYFRPVKEIGEALDRAIQRGVDVTVITRLDLEGDTADFILGAVNKDGVNRFMDKVKVYEYTEPKVILHSKLLMIDDELSFISSVNLNKRSFYHDLENGVLVNDSEFTKEMGEVYKEYMKISSQITEKQKIIFWKRWIIKIFDKVL